MGREVIRRESIAKALLINEQRQVLVLRTGIHQQRPSSSHSPDLPGGVVDELESEHSALLREIYEETGVSLSLGSAALVYAETQLYPAESKSVTKLLYAVRLDHTPSVILSAEHEAYEWCALDAVLSRHEFRPFFKTAIAYAVNNQLV